MDQSPKLMPDWKAQANEITTKLKERADAKAVLQSSERKVYTPTSKYGNPQDRPKSSTTATTDKQSKGGKQKTKNRPASASMVKTARKKAPDSSLRGNLWDTKKGKKHKKLILRNITNARELDGKARKDKTPYETTSAVVALHKKKKTKRARPRSASAARSHSKKTATAQERSLKGLERDVPLTQERIAAEKITDTLIRSTRPKSANVFGRSTTTRAESILQPVPVGRPHGSKYAVKAHGSSGQSSHGASSTVGNRPKSAPHKRPSSAVAAASRKRTVGARKRQQSLPPSSPARKKASSEYIMQSYNIKLTPLEKRENGFIIRPADLAGGIPPYDASKDKYCPLYSPERHVIPGLKSQPIAKSPRRSRKGKRGGNKQDKPERWQRDGEHDRPEDDRIPNRPPEAFGPTGTAMEQAKDALSPPRITFSEENGASPSKEVMVVKAILRREQLLQSLRDAAGRARFNSRLISSLMERYRESTVVTVEAVREWSIGRDDGAFMWHAKNYLLSIPADLDALWHSRNIREFLHFDIRRNPFLVPPTNASNNSGSDDLPTNISYYPGAEVNLKMERLLLAEQIILSEEEKYYEGGHNGFLLPVHWKTVKSPDYIMLRSAIFKDIERGVMSSPEDDEMQGRNTSNAIITVPGVNKETSPKDPRWQSVFATIDNETTGDPPTIVGESESASPSSPSPAKSTSPLPLGTKSIPLDQINVQQVSTPTQTTPRAATILTTAQYKLASQVASPPPAETLRTPQRSAARPMSSDKTWEEIRSRSPVTRKSATWEEHLDPVSQCQWYYNRETNESTWVKPNEWVDEPWEAIQKRSPITQVQAGGKWTESFDPTYNCNWYYNNETGESQWEKPASWNGSPSKITGDPYSPQNAMQLDLSFANGPTSVPQKSSTVTGPVSNDLTIANVQQHERQSRTDRISTVQMAEAITSGAISAVVAKHDSAKVSSKYQQLDASINQVTLNRENRKIEEHFRKLRKSHYSALASFATGQWVEVFDPQCQAFYYWNQSSGSVQWNQPDDFIQAKDDVFILSALKIQALFRANRARHKVRQTRGLIEAAGKTEPSLMWVKAFDPSVNTYYYYNTESREVRWNKPLGVVVFNSPKLDMNAGLFKDEKTNALRVRTNEEVDTVYDELGPSFLSAAYSPISNRSARDEEERAEANTFLSPGQRQLIDDVSILRQQLEVAERELDFARFGFSYANENRSQLSANWDFSVDAHGSASPVRASTFVARSPKAQSVLSSSFAMVHDLCADATQHAHALDVKFGHVLKIAEEERQACITIQGASRKFLKRKKGEAKSRKQHFAATKVQSSWRGSSTRLKMEKRNRAAVKIQTTVRGRQARVCVSKKIEARQERERQERERAEIIKLAQEQSSVRLQTTWRGHHARKRVSQKRQKIKEEKAAVEIQSYARKHRAKRRVQRKKEEKTHAVNAAAAVSIQAQWRGKQQRQLLQQKQTSAIKLQSLARSRYEQKQLPIRRQERQRRDEREREKKRQQDEARAQLLRRRAEEEERHRIEKLKLEQGLFALERKERAKRYQSARAIQAIWRGYITRETYEYVRAVRNERACQIQAAWRGYKCRSAPDNIVANYHNQQIQQVENENKELWAQLCETASVKIQATWRGYATRVIYEELLFLREWGATTIQNSWRRYVAMCNFRATVTNTTKLQIWWRKRLKATEQAMLDRMMLEFIENEAATKIQALVRGQRARAIATSARQVFHEDAERQQRASIRLQSMYRGHLGRRYAEDTSFAFVYGATRIESVYRGHLARRYTRMVRAAVVQIQSWWRLVAPSGARRVYLQRRIVSSSLLVAEQLFSIEKAGGGRAMDSHGNSALLLAVHGGSLRLVKTCLTWGFDPNNSNNFGETPLHVAAATGRKEIVETLIYANADVAAIDSVDRSVIHNAAEFGSNDIVKILVDRGALLDVQDNDGMTPLHLCAINGHVECVSFLVLCGADLHILDNRGESPVHKAAAIGSVDIVHILAEHDGDMNSFNVQSFSPLHFASRNGHSGCVKMLLGFAANPNLQNKKGDTPAHLAARGGFQNCLAHLIEYDANMYIKNIADRTALQEAHLQGHLDVLEFIQAKLTQKESMKANQSRYVPPAQFWESPKKAQQPTGNNLGAEGTVASPVVLSLEDRVNALSMTELSEIIDNEGVDRGRVNDIEGLRELALGILQRPVMQEKGANYVVVTVPPGCTSGNTVAITVPGLGVAHVRVPDDCGPGDKFQFVVPGYGDEDADASSTTSSSTSSSSMEGSSDVRENITERSSAGDAGTARTYNDSEEFFL